MPEGGRGYYSGKKHKGYMVRGNFQNFMFHSPAMDITFCVVLNMTIKSINNNIWKINK